MYVSQTLKDFSSASLSKVKNRCVETLEILLMGVLALIGLLGYVSG